MGNDYDRELAEISSLMSSSTFPGVRAALGQYEMVVRKRKAEAAAAAAAAADPTNEDKMDTDSGEASTTNSKTVQARGNTPAPALSASAQYVPIVDYAWDSSYSSPTVTVYIDLPGVGSVKDSVKCTYSQYGMDLTVIGLEGKNYRLFQDNLDKEIVPENCKTLVKPNKIVLKLGKKKTEMGFDNWTNLVSKKSKEQKEKASLEKGKDPTAGIMDMMKDMYDEGDDNMKKIIGEAMMKSRNKQTGGMDDDSSPIGGGLPDLKMPPGL